MKISYLFLIILLLTAQSFYSQNKGVPIDLNRAVNITVQRFPLITQLSRQVDAIESRVSQLKSNYLPTVDADFDYHICICWYCSCRCLF